VKESKLCESAYLTTSPDGPGIIMHAAAVIERSGNCRHVYMVRGKSTDSVVRELHNQLIRAGRLPRPSSRRGSVFPSLLLFATATAVLGIALTLLGGTPNR
jgi:hypothetical protein